jgi:hypothetical protein
MSAWFRDTGIAAKTQGIISHLIYELKGCELPHSLFYLPLLSESRQNFITRAILSYSHSNCGNLKLDNSKPGFAVRWSSTR